MKSKNLRFQMPLKLFQLILIMMKDLWNILLNSKVSLKMSKIYKQSSLVFVLLSALYLGE